MGPGVRRDDPWRCDRGNALPQIQFLEEVIALVVDDDEGRKILDLDAPDRFHAEFGIFHHLDRCRSCKRRW